MALHREPRLSAGAACGPHRYSLLFINAFKPWVRVPAPSVASPTMRCVDVTSISNFLFTFFVPLLPPGASGQTVESFLGPVDVFHSINAVVLPQRQGRRVVIIRDLTCLHFPQFHPWARRVLFRQTDLPALLNGALAFVYLSLYEGFGLPGGAALLVDPVDREQLSHAMARIVQDEALREDLREQGLKQAQRYLWDETARLTVEVYESEGHGR